MNKRILIVEDSPDILEIMEKTLQARGYDVTALKDGGKALQCIESKLPDLVILDMILQDKTGSEICHEIKTCEKTKHIPVIIATGHINSDHSEYNRDSQPDDYLIKPFAMEDFIRKIEDHLE